MARELVEGYLREPRWFQRAHQERDLAVAYFSAELYDLLEHEIVPLYFERDDRGVPVGF